MADERYEADTPPVVHHYTPPQGNRGQMRNQPINRKLPDILFDERSTYRQDYTEIRPPYSQDLPWKAEDHRPAEIAARGGIPGYYGPKYTDPYNLSRGEPVYQSVGYQRTKEMIADKLAKEQEHGKAIPLPRIIMEDEPIDVFTEYRTNYCKTVTKDSEELPEVTPMHKGMYKYYRNADNFSYNSQQSNKAY